MKRILMLILATCSCAFAQEGGNANVMYQRSGTVTAVAWGDKASATPVKGAPYSATTTDEFIQTLSDGTHIVQSNTGNIARDSQGRTRQDAPLPAIGNLSPSDAPHIVFIQDPVSGKSYTLNLTDKTAWKAPVPPMSVGSAIPDGERTFFMQVGDGGPPPTTPPMPMVRLQKRLTDNEQAEVKESLGSQTMEGVLVNGVRSTRTIPAGEVGNDRPISIVTEVWTSPDLKTIVLSKRSDPRMGEQTFRLTNIVRGEPDASLFTVPADFKMTDAGPQKIIYRTHQ